MLKKIPLFLNIFFLSILTTISAQVEKTVIVEHFTNTRCGVCANRNPDFFTNLDNHPNILHMAIHPSSPYSDCFLNNNNPEQNDERTNYYGIYGSTPKLVIQGENIVANADYGDAEIFAPYLDQTSPIELNLTHWASETNLFFVDLQATNFINEDLEGVKLFVAIVEDTVFYDAPNGEDLHFNVFRKRLSLEDMILTIPAEGTVASFSTGLDENWDASRLRAIAIIQKSDTKEVIQATKSSETIFSALDDIPLQNVNISPNPVQNQLNISLESNIETKLNLIDLTGRTISTSTFQKETQINTSELAKGIYFIELKNEEGRLTQKVVKN